jgi:phosphopantetheine--protein transferase-like protein
MILGVGIDVCSLDRFAESLARTPGLSTRLFTPTERRLGPSSLAARFAAKEALAKALGGPGGLLWTDCEVVHTEAGRPWLRLTGTVQAAAEARGVERTHLSLSHDAGVASAVVILEG